VLDLDVKTLFVVSIAVATVLGGLLLFAWYQNRQVRALKTWGLAHFACCIGAALIVARGKIPDVVSIDLANAIFLIGCGMVWAAARSFDDRAAPMSAILAGAILWLVLVQVPIVRESVDARVILASAIIAIYTFGAGYEVWRSRNDEPLLSRWPLSVTFFVHGAVYALRIVLVFYFPASAAGSMFQVFWFTIISLETLLYLIVSSFMMLAMTKERSELVHKTNAMLDPLTNIPNRRAFLDASTRRLRQHLRQPQPVTALVFDLDHFKLVNDRYGHAVGDEVLRRFTAVAAAEFRSTDLLGRLGGEEFGAVLFGAGEGTAVSTAERIRRALIAATGDIDGRRIDATVSIGLAVAKPGGIESLDALLERADAALYRAKARGRNRVEVAGKLAGGSNDDTFVIEHDRTVTTASGTLRVVGPSIVPADSASEPDVRRELRAV
jgi:diguanylate cyclase (GGDEF)-like protein